MSGHESRSRRRTLPALLAAALAVLSLSPAAARAADTLLSQGKPATASSIEAAAYGAAKAVDVSTATRWSSAFSDPQWIYVDLGATATISRVVLNWEAAYGKAYQIQVSDDATSWTTISTVISGTGGVNDLAVSGSGRYVRMYGTARGTRYGYSLWEFQVYGTGGGGGPPTCSTPPSVPTGVAASSVSSTSVALSWNASTPGANCTITGYRVYQNGVQTTASTGTTASLSGLAPGTTYSFTVAAVNAFGASAQSAALSVAAAPNDSGDGGDGGTIVVPPASGNNRAVFNFDYSWKFTRAPKDIPNASLASFDDSAWTDVSLPHTANDTDTWVDWVGWVDDARLWLKYEGLMWYRKHFTLDATYKDRKVFLEFQGIRNAAVFYVNGTKLGIHDNQVGPCGLDITSAVKFGADNVIAVQVDSNMLHKETSTGYTYGWSSQGFYPLYGGLTKDVVLHVMDRLHQTLPLYSNLGTGGVYAYATNIDTLNRTATFTVESEVANEYGSEQTATFSVDLVDFTGKVVWTMAAPAQAIGAGQTVKLAVAGQLSGIHFWAPDYPYLYTVRSSIKTGSSLVDVTDTTFGVRKISFTAKNGLMVNGHPIYLKGFSPRTVMDWAVVGNPQNWMAEHDFLLMKKANANFVRPMHVAPRRNMVESANKLGIVLICPAGNGEGDDPDTAEGNARWQQRLGVMRDVTIYYRNDPSVFFHEASNSGITDQHMRDMVAVRDQWDPHGGRYAGTRSSDKTGIPSEEYGSSMDVSAQNATIPIYDAEYSREESPRRVWDTVTPVWDPHTGKYVTGGYLAIASPYHVRETAANTGNGIYAYPNCDFRQMSTETMALCNLYRYWNHYSNSAFVLDEASRLSKGVNVGASKIFFADSDSDGRMKDTEVSRVSGTVDGVRLPKESYYAMQVAQNEQPQVHIIGHWSYAAGTRKMVYVVGNTETVKLATYDPNGNLVKDCGQGVRDNQTPKVNQYVFRFDDVAWQPGRIVATGQNGGKDVATQTKVSAGAPVAIRLTSMLGPDGFFADGADIAMIDVEIVDAAGNRVPTDEAEVDFSHTGEGQFLGGYNSGVRQSTFKDTLWTEAGINRVFVRATRKAGDFTLTVKRAGLPDSSLTITSRPFPVDANGLTVNRSQRYSLPLPVTEPTPVADPGVGAGGTG